MRRPQPVPSLDELTAHVADWGITHIGVCSAEVLSVAREALHERKAQGLDAGMGFTYRNPDRSTDPTRAVAEAHSIIVAARPYLSDVDPPEPPQADRPAARVAKYAWVDHYAPLREGLRSAAKLIRRSGHKAVAFADDNSVVDRAVAHRAGIGWFGKNANLLLPGAGSFFVLGSIITTADYPWSARQAPDGCGSCTSCITACPTNAIVGPAVIDANRCLSWVLQRPGSIPLEFREAIGDRIYGCDDCQDHCPVSVRLGTRNTIALPRDVQAWVPALELLDQSDEWLEREVGRWYVADRDFDLVRRNALVVVGNVGDPDDTRVRDTIKRYRAGGHRMLAEHAEWAAQRLDQRREADADLEHSTADDGTCPDPA